MSHLLNSIKTGIIKVLPVVVFFLVTFNLIGLTSNLMVRGYVEPVTFIKATVGALIAVKVLLVVDLLPFVDRYRTKPLIFNTLWKTAFYEMFVFLYKICEHYLPLLFKYQNFLIANQHFFEDVNWPKFWAIQLWMLVLLFVLVASRELIRYLGVAQVRQIFWGQIID
jgi:hypothetical protein